MPQNSKWSNCIIARFNQILGILKAKKIDGLLLNSTFNISYACGFHAPDSYLLASTKGTILITDFRYSADFRRKAASAIKVKEYKDSVFKVIVQSSRDLSLKSVGFESRHLTFAECHALHDLSAKSLKWIPLKETLEPLREIKDEEEKKNMTRAIKITLKAFAFIKSRLKPGLKEFEIAAEIERFIRLEGAQSSAFNIIVASGPNSSFPHAQVTQRILQEGDPVIIDMGVEYNGYKCDLTRTFFLGKIKPIVHRIAEIVGQAQQRAIKTIRPGIPIREVDLSARNYISKEGFGKNFGHALGHGVGLQVHESPSINRKNTQPIRKGTIFTVEPAIYRSGDFGVRIEDMVLVTDKGVEVLSGHNSD